MGGRVAPMEYSIIQLESDRKVVLRGSGSNVEAIDEITFAPTVNGTRVDYRADIRLTGLLRLLTPFTGRAFASIARNARTGMKTRLDAIAAESRAVA
jgi:carbon monoxide dehydrogenase subunit G